MMAPVSPLTPRDPVRVDRYALHGVVRRGRFSTLYLARHEGEKRQVAVKVLDERWAGYPQVRSRLAELAEAAGRVPPRCTVPWLDANTEAACPFMVGEYVDGPSLFDAVSQGGPFSEPELLRLAAATATALEAVHTAGLVHWDFRPSKVLFGPDGPQVIDFGLSHVFLGDSETMTALHRNPAYLAPEQLEWRGGSAVDIFAWGAVMVFAATGQAPFSPVTGELIAQILEGRLDLHGYAGALRPLIEAAVLVDPDDRPTAPQLLRQLRTRL